MNNLVIIENSLNTINDFINGLNNYTNYIIYNNQEISIDSLKNINYLGFVYHYQGYNRFPFFQDNEILDENGYLEPTFQIFSNKFTIFLTELKKINPNIIIDILTCNIFDTYFISLIQNLSQTFNIPIRYSTNNKGSLSGSDWIQESHNINIKPIYFSEQINNWKHILNTGIPIENLTSIFRKVDNTFYLKSNINWDTNIQGLTAITDFIVLSSNQILDGNGFEITITNNPNYQGIISTNDISVSSFLNSPTIQNLKVTWDEMPTTAAGGALGYYGGIIRREQKFFKINGCIAKSKKTTGLGGIGGQCGGICGFFCGLNGGNFQIENCIYDGNVGFSSANQGAGGIVGGNCVGTNILIKNCYITGSIIAQYSGGIVGTRIGRQNSIVIIENCFSLGAIGSFSGGICGSECGRGATSLIIRNSYSVGNINTNGGGITGQDTARRITTEENVGNCIIENCYSLGTVNTSAGAIMGSSISTNIFGTRQIRYCIGRTRIHGTNTTSTQTSNSIDLNTIFNKIYSFWSNSIWQSVSNNYPILVSFTISPWSNYSIHTNLPTFTFSFRPEPPTLNEITSTVNSITIKWNIVNNVSNFIVKKYEDNNWITLSNTIMTEFLDNNLDSLKLYKYRIFNFVNNEEQDYLEVEKLTEYNFLGKTFNDILPKLISSNMTNNQIKNYLRNTVVNNLSEKVHRVRLNDMLFLTNSSFFINHFHTNPLISIILLNNTTDIDGTGLLEFRNSFLIITFYYLPLILGDIVNLRIKGETFKIEALGTSEITSIRLTKYDSNLASQIVDINNYNGFIYDKIRVTMFGGIGISSSDPYIYGAVGSDPYIINFYGEQYKLEDKEQWWVLLNDRRYLEILGYTSIYNNEYLFQKILVKFVGKTLTIDFDLNMIITKHSNLFKISEEERVFAYRYKKKHYNIKAKYKYIEFFHPIFQTIKIFIDFKLRYIYPEISNYVEGNYNGLFVKKIEN